MMYWLPTPILSCNFQCQWAGSSETSFLLTQDQTTSVLETAGFTCTAWDDVTMEGLNWMAQLKPPIQGFSLGLVMGPRFAEMAVNFARNLREGRARLVMGVCRAAN